MEREAPAGGGGRGRRVLGRRRGRRRGHTSSRILRRLFALQTHPTPGKSLTRIRAADGGRRGAAAVPATDRGARPRGRGDGASRGVRARTTRREPARRRARRCRVGTRVRQARRRAVSSADGDFRSKEAVVETLPGGDGGGIFARGEGGGGEGGARGESRARSRRSCRGSPGYGDPARWLDGCRDAMGGARVAVSSKRPAAGARGDAGNEDGGRRGGDGVDAERHRVAALGAVGARARGGRPRDHRPRRRRAARKKEKGRRRIGARAPAPRRRPHVAARRGGGSLFAFWRPARPRETGRTRRSFGTRRPLAARGSGTSIARGSAGGQVMVLRARRGGAATRGWLELLDALEGGGGRRGR